MMKCERWSIFLSAMLLAASLQAQDLNKIIADLETAYEQNKIESLKTTAAALANFQSDDKKHQAVAAYYRGFAAYRLAMAARHGHAQKGFATQLDNASEHLKLATKLDAQHADAWALLSTVYGMQISIDQSAAAMLGPESMLAMQTALQLEPENPRVVLLQAIQLYYTPAEWGGSPEIGLKGFKRAAKLFQAAGESAASAHTPRWGHDEAWAWIGFAYMEKKQLSKAREACEKALAINPNNARVQHSILPQLR